MQKPKQNDIDRFNDELTLSKEYSLVLFQKSRTPLIVMDSLTYRYIDCNEAAVKIYGYHSKEDVLNKTPLDVSAPVQYDGRTAEAVAREKIEIALREGEIFFEWRHKRPSGEEWDAEVHLMAFEFSGRKMLQFSLLDISERKQSQFKFQEAYDTYRGMLNSITEAVYIQDEYGRFLDVNHAVEVFYGYPHDYFIGKSPEFLSAPGKNDISHVIVCLKKAYGGEPQQFEFWAMRKNGTIFPKEVTVAPCMYFGKKAVIAVARDITERKNAEEEQKKLQNQLQQAMKMEALGRLAGGIAHDFNNLLTAIIGNATLAALQTDKSLPVFGKINEIRKAAESAASLTRQLLAFSRKQMVEPKLVNIDDLLSVVSEMLRRVIGEDIILDVRRSNKPVTCIADQAQFEQIILNLAVNARDAMPNGGKIVIETDIVILDHHYCHEHPYVKQGEYVMLAISDTGHGISKENMKHIFEPFFTTKSLGHGTGLGLATIYGAVKQAGGSIEVYSEEGIGTTFKMYLPFIPGTPVDVVSEPIKDDIIGGNETILLVEDEPAVREFTISFLKEIGYTVIQAASGEAALKELANFNGKLDFVLSDVVMPGMNGKELVEKVVQKFPKVKILYASGYTRNVIAHHGIIEEGVNFIGKPYTPHSLAAKIRSLLDAKP